MRLDVTFRHLSPRPGVRERAEERFQRLERFLDPNTSAALVFEATRGTVVGELLIAVRGQVAKAVGEGHDLRALVDELFHQIEHPLRRAKERASGHGRDSVRHPNGRTATQY
jgi:ribosomal subunit interface protein